jgi:hypothetical protein
MVVREAAMALGRMWMVAAILAALAQGQRPDQDPHAHHRATPTPAAGGWVEYHHKTAGFSLDHPADWEVAKEKTAVSIHISHPTRPVHLYASAFVMTEGTLQEFAELKFGVQPEIFKPLGPPRTLDGAGWTGLVQDAEAIQDSGHTRRRILCARHGNLYVSLALYLDAQELAAPVVDYDRLFTSLRFDAPRAAAPTPPPAQPHH